MTARQVNDGSDQSARLALVERGLAVLDEEMERARDRLHALEAERAAVQLLSAGLTGLRDEIKAMRAEARASVPEALKALRNELQIFARDTAKAEIGDALKERDNNRRSNWGLRVAMFMGTIGACTFLLSLSIAKGWIH